MAVKYDREKWESFELSRQDWSEVFKAKVPWQGVETLLDEAELMTAAALVAMNAAKNALIHLDHTEAVWQIVVFERFGGQAVAAIDEFLEKGLVGEHPVMENNKRRLEAALEAFGAARLELANEGN